MCMCNSETNCSQCRKVSLYTPLQVKQFTKQLSEAPLVCVDGNVPNDTIEFVCNFCSDAGIPGVYRIRV